MNNYNPYYRQTNNYYPPISNGITWVQGIEGAKAFQLAPNSNVVLMDSEREGIFYIKISDNIGMCSLRIFKYEEVKDNLEATVPPVDLSEYVKKSELQDLISNITKEAYNEQPIPAAKPRRNLLE